MWTAVLTAAISATAALGGVFVNGYLTGKRSTVEFDRKRRESDRAEMLNVAAEILSKSWHFRRATLPIVNDEKLMADLGELGKAIGEIEHLASRLRLLAGKFRTAVITMELSAGLHSTLQAARSASGAESPEHIRDLVTLRLAAAKMQEIAFLGAIREECEIPEAEGTPDFDFDRDIRIVLRSVFRNDEAAVERMAQQISEMQPSVNERQWRL